MKNRHEAEQKKAANSALRRYPEPSARLGEVLARNLAQATDPELRERLTSALERLRERTEFRPPQMRRKSGRQIPVRS